MLYVDDRRHEATTDRMNVSYSYIDNAGDKHVTFRLQASLHNHPQIIKIIDLDSKFTRFSTHSEAGRHETATNQKSIKNWYI